MASVLPVFVSALLMLCFINHVQGVPAFQYCDCFSENEQCPPTMTEAEQGTCDSDKRRCCTPLRKYHFAFPDKFSTVKSSTTEPNSGSNSIEHKWG